MLIKASIAHFNKTNFSEVVKFELGKICLKILLNLNITNISNVPSSLDSEFEVGEVKIQKLEFNNRHCVHFTVVNIFQGPKLLPASIQ